MATVRPQPLIVVADVEASSRWYRSLLGVESGRGEPEYERLVDPGEEGFVLQLHDWDADEHEHLGDPHRSDRGNGILLWFQLDDLNAALDRLQHLDAEVLVGPLVNPTPSTERSGCGTLTATRSSWRDVRAVVGQFESGGAWATGSR